MKKAVGALAVLAALLLAACAWVVRSTFSRLSGRLLVSGISAPVRIETDAHGVPTIRAGSLKDALFGLGYVHARDRLWQMEYQRRIGSGRLSEILGKSLVASDRFLRTVGFRRAAESAWKATSGPARAALESYAAGINQHLRVDSSRSIEFLILRARPEPFTPIDSLAWAKMMAWDLAGNAAGEIRRARLVAAVGAKRTEELLPAAPPEPTILEDSEWQAPPVPLPTSPTKREIAGSVPASLASELDRLTELGFGGEELGSNSWVVAGSRTRSGRPLLANDPHLALRTPSVWYLARLEVPGLSLAGATLPGVPGVIIGQNGRIAWGLTSLEPDVQDLYVEEVDPKDPGRYFHRGEWKQFQTREETIPVRGAAAERLRIRASVHGPIVTDVLTGADRLGSAVALRWTGLDAEDHTAEAFLGIDSAENWSQFLQAVSRLHCPAQNFVYADADGHIGYTASGAIPVRPRADGLLPVSGTGGDDWTGLVPFSRLPRTLDPERGFVVTANNRVVSERYPYAFSHDWPEPYRARRIRDRILAADTLGLEDMRSIQSDRVSYQARELLPLLLDTSPRDAASADALRRLRVWNCDFAPDSVPASLYAVWYAALARMPQDELAGIPLGSVRSRFLIRALRNEADWCDDVSTARRETCADFKSATLQQAVATPERKLGGDPSGWRWERLHRAHLPHGVFDRSETLRRFFSLEVGQGGDASTVNVGAYRLDGSFTMTDGPSYRQAIDLSDPSRSTFVIPGGQSGNVFDPHYRDLLPLWRDGREFSIPSSGTPSTLELVPRRAPASM